MAIFFILQRYSEVSTMRYVQVVEEVAAGVICVVKLLLICSKVRFMHARYKWSLFLSIVTREKLSHESRTRSVCVCVCVCSHSHTLSHPISHVTAFLTLHLAFNVHLISLLPKRKIYACNKKVILLN